MKKFALKKDNVKIEFLTEELRAEYIENNNIESPELCEVIEEITNENELIETEANGD